jgi:hypothetical protein
MRIVSPRARIFAEKDFSISLRLRLYCPRTAVASALSRRVISV